MPEDVRAYTEYGAEQKVPQAGRQVLQLLKLLGLFDF